MDLAIKMDKRKTLLLGLSFFLGAIVCLGIYFLLISNETFEMTRYLFLVMTGSGIFEGFRTLGKYSKIQQRHRPVVKVQYEGRLTREQILKDGGKVLKKAGYAFNIAKLPLYDKEDEVDIGVDNDTHHQYHLYFKNNAGTQLLTYKVKRSRYMDAVIGVEYLVVITAAGDVAAVYQATNWAVDDALLPSFVTP